MRHREARGSRDQVAIARLGGVGLAAHDVNRRLRVSGGEVLRVFRKQLIDDGGGGIRVSGREMGLDQRKPRADVFRTVGCEFREGSDHLVRSTFGLQRREFEAVRELRRSLYARVSDRAGELPDASVILPFKVDATEKRQQLEVLRRAPKRVQHGILGRSQTSVGDQIARVPQSFGGAEIGRLDGPRKTLSGEIMRPFPLVSLRHERQYLGIVRGIGQGGIQIEERLFRVVGIDVTASAHLERVDMPRIGRENLVHESGGFVPFRRREKHLSQSDPKIAEFRRVLLDRSERAKPLDRLFPTAEREIELRQSLEKGRVVRFRINEALQLGPRGVGAFGLQHELGDVETTRRILRRPRRDVTQQRQGGDVVPLRQMPTQERLCGLVVFGVGLNHPFELIADTLGVPQTFEQRQPGDVQIGVVGSIGEGRIGEGQRGLEILRRHPLGYEHEPGRDARRVFGQHLVGHRHPALGVAFAKDDRRHEFFRAGVFGKQFERPANMGRGHLEVAQTDGEAGKFEMRRTVVRILFDQSQIMPCGLARVALRREASREFEPGLREALVLLQRVAELDLRRSGVPFGEERHGALIVLFGSLLRAVATGQKNRQKKSDNIRFLKNSHFNFPWPSS